MDFFCKLSFKHVVINNGIDAQLVLPYWSILIGVLSKGNLLSASIILISTTNCGASFGFVFGSFLLGFLPVFLPVFEPVSATLGFSGVSGVSGFSGVSVTVSPFLGFLPVFLPVLGFVFGLEPREGRSVACNRVGL